MLKTVLKLNIDQNFKCVKSHIECTSHLVQLNVQNHAILKKNTTHRKIAQNIWRISAFKTRINVIFDKNNTRVAFFKLNGSNRKW